MAEDLVRIAHRARALNAASIVIEASGIGVLVAGVMQAEPWMLGAGAAAVALSVLVASRAQRLCLAVWRELPRRSA